MQGKIGDVRIVQDCAGLCLIMQDYIGLCRIVHEKKSPAPCGYRAKGV